MSRKNYASIGTRRDLVRTPAALWLWCLPIALIIFANLVWNGRQLPATIMGVLLTVSTAWVGVACYVNGQRCGRMHCKIDGILLPLLSLIGLLNLLGVTVFGWNVYSAAFWIILFLSYVPEFYGMTYLS